MITGVTFRGGESTGGVADRTVETAKQETTGGVGARNNQDSIFTVDNELKQDTVCFRGYGDEEKKTSTTTKVVGTLVGVAAVIGLLGLANKYNWAGKISDGKFKEYSDVVTKPCHDACKWIKNNSYDKIVNFFKNK